MAKFFLSTPDNKKRCATCGEEIVGDHVKIISYDHKKKVYNTKLYHYECKKGD